MSRIVPILFNTDMVRAILRNMKNATRRAIKGFIPSDAIWGYTAFTPKGYISCRGTFADGYGEKFFRLPCQPGDTLYVRETWGINGLFSEDDEKFYIVFEYKADGSYTTVEVSEEIYDKYDYSMAENSPEWRPSIHMPKEAARIWLRVTDVRVERLQDMKLNDFLDEGVVIRPEAFNDPDNVHMQAKDEFIAIWDSTIPKEKQDLFSWAAAPWVWVIEFKQCEKPESEE